MKEECSKYGTVNHAHVDKNSKVALLLCNSIGTAAMMLRDIAPGSA